MHVIVCTKLESSNYKSMRIYTRDTDTVIYTYKVNGAGMFRAVEISCTRVHNIRSKEYYELLIICSYVATT